MYGEESNIEQLVPKVPLLNNIYPECTFHEYQKMGWMATWPVSM